MQARRRGRLGGLLALALAVAACDPAGSVPSAVVSGPSATPLEQMPAPAGIWLTSVPVAPASPVAVVMTSPDEASIRFAHTFGAGAPLRGSFATSEGRYVLAALDDACSLPLDLAPDEAVDVVLSLGPGSACSFAVARRGRMGDSAMAHTEDSVVITNHDAGAATPAIEPVTPSAGS